MNDMRRDKSKGLWPVVREYALRMRRWGTMGGKTTVAIMSDPVGPAEDVTSIQSELKLPSRSPFLAMGLLCGSRIFSIK